MYEYRLDAQLLNYMLYIQTLKLQKNRNSAKPYLNHIYMTIYIQTGKLLFKIN